MSCQGTLERTDPRRAGRRGFTLVELAVVVAVIGFLASIAIPNFQRAVLKARATDAVSELHVIRIAVMNYVGDKHTWPADVGRGRIPTGLAEFLPSGFTFTPEGYVVDYDNWSTKSQGFIGLTVITTDAQLGQAVVDILGPNSWTDGGTKFTWVIEWTD